jgi:hypothetical protein
MSRDDKQNTNKKETTSNLYREMEVIKTLAEKME